MKGILKKLRLQKIGILTALLLSSVSCIGEDAFCPKGVDLVFECINTDYSFRDVADELELLLYSEDGSLAYEMAYSREVLDSLSWRVHFDDDMSGRYTLLALANYGDDKMSVEGRENLETLQAEIERDGEGHVAYALPDTYYGRYELGRNDFVKGGEHRVMMSKNTNKINLILRFQDETDFNMVTVIDSRIEGYNALYRWDNTAPQQDMVTYNPLDSSRDDGERTITHYNQSMRIWTEADLALEFSFVADGLREYRIEIPEALAEIEVNGEYPYDTDEKLEHHDEFTFEVVYRGGYIVAAIIVNGWYQIVYDIEV